MPKNTYAAVQRSNKRLAARNNRPHTHSDSIHDSDHDAAGGGESAAAANSTETSASSTTPVRQPKLFHASREHDRAWSPTVATVFKVLISLRLSSALWSPIADCDEVYNYWEPLHLFLYKTGFQTWEYSPVYAIRSYLYVWLHSLIAQPFQLLLPHTKITTFFFVRCTLASLTALADLYLYSAVRERVGNAVARYQIALAAVSSGYFISTAAFLPSSFSMILTAAATAAYLRQEWVIAIVCTAVSALVGWPFAAILGLPIVAHMTLERPTQIYKLAFVAAVAGGLISGALLVFDSHYYGRTVLAPLNIILYNVFTAHGPSLYGTEPVTFYVSNLALNWNLAWPLALLALPAVLLASMYTTHGQASSLSNSSPVVYIYTSMVVWLLIFFVQPHKEERFMYPIYPLIALCAALTLAAVERLANYAWSKRGTLISCVCGAVLTIFLLLSVSRSAAVYRHYHAPVDVYIQANERLMERISEQHRLAADSRRAPPPPTSLNMCTGKEWYRFPSSFFVPESRSLNGTQLRFWFIKSEFRGLLPKPYVSQMDSHLSLTDLTRRIPSGMNDANREETEDRYLDVDDCDYLIDLQVPTADTTELEPDFASMDTHWTVLHAEKFLLAKHSPRLARAFYIPGWSERHAVYGRYALLERIR